jgi:hypothetical protein
MKVCDQDQGAHQRTAREIIGAQVKNGIEQWLQIAVEGPRDDAKADFRHRIAKGVIEGSGWAAQHVKQWAIGARYLPFAKQIKDRDECDQISVAHGGHLLASDPFNQFDENRCHFFTPLGCGGHGSFWENVVPREIAHYFGGGHGFAFNGRQLSQVQCFQAYGQIK